MGKPPDKRRTHPRAQELARDQQRLAAEMFQRAQAMAAMAHGMHEDASESVRQARRARSLLGATANLIATQPLATPAVSRAADGRQVASEIERALDHERSQLARDLHDDLGQTLAALRLRLSPLLGDRRADVRRLAAELAELVALADVATRSLAAQLAPAVLQDEGLLPALRWLAGEIGHRFGVTVTVSGGGTDVSAPPETASIAYRAVRELLINVAKHAGVDRAELHLRCADGQLLIQVRDGGAGLGRPGAQQPGFGLGLQGVRDRVALLGGRFRISTPAEGGTLAELTLPVEPGASAKGS